MSFNGAYTIRWNNDRMKTGLADMPTHYLNYSGEHMWFFLPYIDSLLAILRFIKDAKFNPKYGAEKRYIALLKSYISLPEKKFLSFRIVLTEDKDLRAFDKELEIVKDVENGKQLDPYLYMYMDQIKNTYKV